MLACVYEVYFTKAARVRPEMVKRQKQNKDLYRAFYAKPTSIAHGASPFCSDTCRSQDKPSLCPAYVCAPTMSGYSSVICSLAGRQQEHSRNGEGMQVSCKTWLAKALACILHACERRLEQKEGL